MKFPDFSQTWKKIHSPDFLTFFPDRGNPGGGGGGVGRGGQGGCVQRIEVCVKSKKKIPGGGGGGGGGRVRGVGFGGSGWM